MKPQQDDSKQVIINQPPGASRFTIYAKLGTGLEQVLSKLAAIPSCTLKQAEGKAILLHVATRGINKKPLVFSIMEFGKRNITVSYTYAPGMSPRKRFFDVLSFLLSILTMLKDDYEVDIAQFYQLVSKVLDELNDYVNLKYEALYSMYDNLNSEMLRMQKELKMLKEANEQLSIENYVQKTKNNELQAKLDKYMNLSDDVLKVKVQEWIVSHGGEIDIVEFAKVYGVYEGRIEQILSELMQEGFIDVK